MAATTEPGTAGTAGAAGATDTSGAAPAAYPPPRLPAPRPGAAWRWRAARAADVEPLAELRAVVLRPDLERLGRYDEHRVRQRLRDSFAPRHSHVVLVDGELAGCLTVRPVADGWLLEHFYLVPHRQGRGLGSAVLGAVLSAADAAGVPVRLTVLRGSAAGRLYERHGFRLVAEDPVDLHLARRPVPPAA
ncbi:GNAT family N-acetyltransferase [Streptomyces sp. DSM 44915]|uniref:GNAT family N-acetyltransferase n=1 Tax=Streptomyces chisholmiae TaxID=3075540 RepID=A0ABU2JNW0_9ACTN|nr:GNAT family N-acetyltransferase [Streptomyces sp. DSM 44915]MDT0266672.1 GNAT family N-acetyltransferase [Streptomyces sp. DSM 44915]